MNSVSKIWLTQGGYKVTISVYDPNGTLVTSKYFKDNDNASINFVPNKEGKYTVTTQITGTLSGTIMIVTMQLRMNIVLAIGQ